MKYCLLLLALALGGCSLLSHHEAPDVALAGLRLGAGDGLHQVVLVDLILTNRDASAFQLNALSYRVVVEGREIAAGSSREPLDLPVGGSVKYTVPATLNLISSFSFVRDVLLRPKNKVSYEITATLEPAGLFSMPISVRRADMLSLPQ